MCNHFSVTSPELNEIQQHFCMHFCSHFCLHSGSSIHVVAETSPAKMHRRDAHFACSLKKEDAFPAKSPLSLSPGKLSVVTHICFFQTECKMTPCPCIVAGPVSAKKPICITLWSYLVKKGTAVIHFQTVTWLVMYWLLFGLFLFLFNVLIIFFLHLLLCVLLHQSMTLIFGSVCFYYFFFFYFL